MQFTELWLRPLGTEQGREKVGRGKPRITFAVHPCATPYPCFFSQSKKILNSKMREGTQSRLAIVLSWSDTSSVMFNYSLN